MKLSRDGIREKTEWNDAGIALPGYDVDAAAKKAKEAPRWAHFGIGNIFRIFIGGIADGMLESKDLDTALTCVETFDYDVVDKIYRPYDNLGLSVILRETGKRDYKVLGCFGEAVRAQADDPQQWDRLKEIFASPSLQLVSFTITEKGYALTNAAGKYFPFVQADIDNGPDKVTGAMGVLTAMLLERYRHGKTPLALVSMDNCSQNGSLLRRSVLTMTEEWQKKGYVDEGFAAYVADEAVIAFPWTMIDKITPRPDASVEEILRQDGVEDTAPVRTSRQSYTAPFVNAEECEYLVIEDDFPNGRPPLEEGGFLFTDRETVNRVERMKVCTCLNPLHTALAVFGCLLGYRRISDEMSDPQLKKLAETIGYIEGLPVVTDPGVLDPRSFLDTVLQVRIPNPFMPDTPQRIATDTSQKLAIRYGETIKAYLASPILHVDDLKCIPLVFAGWLRYLTGVDDRGNPFELSPDPLLDALRPLVSQLTADTPDHLGELLRPLLKNDQIFGVDLEQAGLSQTVCQYLSELLSGPGSIRRTLEKYLG